MIEYSSPYNPSSNGLAEAAVKNTKGLLKKCLETKENYHDALFLFRATPRSDGDFSPADLFFGRRVRIPLPSFKREKGYDWDVLRKARHNETKQQRHGYNLRNRTHLSPLSVGDSIVMQDIQTKRWDKGGEVIKVLPSGYSYEIRGEKGGHYVRNRRYIRPAGPVRAVNNANFKANYNAEAHSKALKQTNGPSCKSVPSGRSHSVRFPNSTALFQTVHVVSRYLS